VTETIAQPVRLTYQVIIAMAVGWIASFTANVSIWVGS